MKLDLLQIINSGVDEQTEIYIVAEIGINHNGDMSIAKKLIEEAANSGCNAVKFQKRSIEKVYSKDFLDQLRESPWGTTQRDQKLGLEFNESQYRELREYAKDLGLDFSASAWDLDSLRFVENLVPSFHKVASAFITNAHFLGEVAKLRRPTLISTGMCTEKDIEKAISIFESHNCPFIIMHSVSVYPCPEEKLNLLAIRRFRELFNVNIGYSGHESSVSPTLCAAALGAKVIERHITLSRAMYGSDQSASLESDGLRRLVAGLRKYPKILGSGEKRFDPDEQLVAKKLRYWAET